MRSCLISRELPKPADIEESTEVLYRVKVDLHGYSLHHLHD